MAKKSFILYCDTYKNIKDLPLEDKGKLLDAIFNHALNKPVDVDGIVGMAFNFIKSQMDRDITKYDSFVEKQRVNGAKGGRPKKNPSLNNDNPNNPSLNSETQKSLNDTVTANDNKILFKQFWDLYDLKRSKPIAFKAFTNALKKIDIDTMLKAVSVYNKSISDIKYKKLPTTWLNQECWNDEYKTQSVNGGNIKCI